MTRRSKIAVVKETNESAAVMTMMTTAMATAVAASGGANEGIKGMTAVLMTMMMMALAVARRSISTKKVDIKNGVTGIKIDIMGVKVDGIIDVTTLMTTMKMIDHENKNFMVMLMIKVMIQIIKVPAESGTAPAIMAAIKDNTHESGLAIGMMIGNGNVDIDHQCKMAMAKMGSLTKNDIGTERSITVKVKVLILKSK